MLFDGLFGALGRRAWPFYVRSRPPPWGTSPCRCCPLIVDPCQSSIKSFNVQRYFPILRRASAGLVAIHSGSSGVGTAGGPWAEFRCTAAPLFVPVMILHCYGALTIWLHHPAHRRPTWINQRAAIPDVVGVVSCVGVPPIRCSKQPGHCRNLA